MIRRPPRSTRTDTLFPYTTLFRALRITLKLLLSLDLTSHLKIGANTIVIVVRVYEIPPGIVGRVNIDCFDFSVIALLQELEDFEVVTFNQEIARPVPLDAFIRT